MNIIAKQLEDPPLGAVSPLGPETLGRQPTSPKAKAVTGPALDLNRSYKPKGVEFKATYISNQ